MAERAIVRERQDSDLEACAEALVRVHANDGYPVEGVADPVAWLLSEGLLRSWVADQSGTIVGHVSISRPAGEDAVAMWLERSGDTEESVGVLARLFVVREARGQALGSRLMAAATQGAQQLGRRLVLDVMTKDTAAIRLYENLGWERIGTTTHEVDGSSSTPAYCYVSPGADHGET